MTSDKNLREFLDRLLKDVPDPFPPSAKDTLYEGIKDLQVDKGVKVLPKYLREWEYEILRGYYATQIAPLQLPTFPKIRKTIFIPYAHSWLEIPRSKKLQDNTLLSKETVP